MKRAWIFGMILVLLLGACGLRPAVAPYPEKVAGGAPEIPMLSPTMIVPESAGMRTADFAALPSDAALPAAGERLVIQNVNMTLVVSDVEKKMAEIARLAEEMGGFVVSSNIYKVTTPAGQEAPQGNITVRVPAERLDEALGRIKEQTIEVRGESRHGQDVTREYVDLKSRLRNLEAAEEQLVEIMQKAEKTEDVMNVFNQLVMIREQIEQVKGQIQYYEESAALSAISVELIAEETVKPLEIGGWKPKGVARDALQNLIYFLQGFVNFLINFFLWYLWVFLLAVALPLWVLYRLGRFFFKRWRKSAAASKSEASQPGGAE
ncbi:MAG: DUF4349 domain-containing protein [Anaerolineales bacterium]